jgi:GAF domain-containing protein
VSDTGSVERPDAEPGSPAERHLHALHRLATTALDTTSAEAVYSSALDALRSALGADRAAILLADADGVMRFRASVGLSEGYRQQAEGHSPWSPTDPAPRPVLVPDVATDPSLGDLLTVVLSEGIRSLAFIPITFGGRLLGKFMAYYDRPYVYSDDEVDVASTIAAHIGFTLEKRRLEHELREANRRLAATLDAVGEGITAQAADGSLLFVNEVGARMMGVRSPAEAMATPVAEIARRFEMLDERGEPLPLHELPGRRALAGEHPPELLVRWRMLPSGEERWSLVWARPVADDQGRVEFAVNVFRDVTASQHALHALRRSERRFAFMAAATRSLLSASLDYASVLDRTADLFVPGVGDWCVVHELRDDGTVGRVALRHGTRLPADAAARLEPHLRRPHPLLARLLEGGGGRLVADMEDEAGAELAVDAQHLEAMRALGTTSAMLAPLRSRERLVGAVTVGTCDPAALFGPDDLSLLEEVAARAGLAIDNARVYQSELRARAQAEAAGARLELLSEVTSVLASSLDVDALLRGLSRHLVPILADQCVVDLAERGGVRRVAVIDRDDRAEPLARERDPAPPARGDRAHPVVQVLTTGRSRLEAGAAAGLVGGWALVVPIPGRERMLGAITFGTREARSVSDDDVRLAEEIARRAGVAIENARLYQERARVATTLQEALLPPDLPPIPGASLAARYQAAAGSIGGDFYDVVPVGRDRWLLVVGDVCGRGIEAAALTAMTRYTLRGMAYHDPVPSRLLTNLNQALHPQLPDESFCTIACGLLERDGSSFRTTFALAGHPRPIVVRAGGSVELPGTYGRVIGSLPVLDTVDEHLVLCPGDAIALFTDGCLPSRGEGAESEEPLLAAAAAAGSHDPARLAEAIQTAAGSSEDDKAVVVVRVSG